MNSPLPDLDEPTKKKLAQMAMGIVRTRGPQANVVYLATAFVENVKLTREVNRLRAQVGEELLPVHEFQ